MSVFWLSIVDLYLWSRNEITPGIFSLVDLQWEIEVFFTIVFTIYFREHHILEYGTVDEPYLYPRIKSLRYPKVYFLNASSVSSMVLSEMSQTTKKGLSETCSLSPRNYCLKWDCTTISNVPMSITNDEMRKTSIQTDRTRCGRRSCVVHSVFLISLWHAAGYTREDKEMTRRLIQRYFFVNYSREQIILPWRRALWTFGFQQERERSFLLTGCQNCKFMLLLLWKYKSSPRTKTHFVCMMNYLVHAFLWEIIRLSLRKEYILILEETRGIANPINLINMHENVEMISILV